MHAHPRLVALSGLTEIAAPFSLETSDSFARPSLSGPAQSFTAVLRGPDQSPPQEVSAEEPGAVQTSRADVPDKPAEPLSYREETPKTFGDIKMATKVLKPRCDVAFRARSRLGSGFPFLMQICALTYLPQGHGDER